jgi:UDP-N-acetylmuramate dehydrogenase
MKNSDENIKKDFLSTFDGGSNIEFDRNLAPFTTFSTGGPADIFVKARNITDVQKTLILVKKHSLPIFILGGGSNILIGDKGFRGVVLKNEIESIEKDGDFIKVGSGLALKSLLNYCIKESLTGIEFMAGIYGTLGGAIAGNAGAYGREIGKFVDSIDIIDLDGGQQELKQGDLLFSYRKFRIKSFDEKATYFIASCRLKLKTGDLAAITSKIDEILRLRDSKMLDPLPSAGCFFKNIEKEGSPHGKLAAGKILDEIGAKNMGNERVGVHDLHANIIMNKHGANSKEILEFAKKLQKLAFEKCGVRLETEVKLVGEF